MSQLIFNKCRLVTAFRVSNISIFMVNISLFSCSQFLEAMLQFMSLLPKLMQQQVDEDLRLREQSILVSYRCLSFKISDIIS